MCSTDLSNLKSDVDKLNVKKIKTIPVDLKKLSDVVKILLRNEVRDQ